MPWNDDQDTEWVSAWLTIIAMLTMIGIAAVLVLVVMVLGYAVE